MARRRERTEAAVFIGDDPRVVAGGDGEGSCSSRSRRGAEGYAKFEEELRGDGAHRGGGDGGDALADSSEGDVLRCSILVRRVHRRAREWLACFCTE
jgi:hypothetical protein